MKDLLSIHSEDVPIQMLLIRVHMCNSYIQYVPRCNPYTRALTTILSYDNRAFEPILSPLVLKARHLLSFHVCLACTSLTCTCTLCVIPLSLFLMLNIGPNSYTYAHVHVHNIGIIIGVNEDDAFSWPVCSHCHGDQLAESTDNPR